ncbi:protein DEHYDRATION-INDUCED 19 homolog 5-like isoform X2 [Phragmites australis]|uniref:protein DEHYDRATION-INDUCED 19 homolog 5-like isoform X2 n=1 Tax=Phragmites australis TaxID=29695 RepID=UPI002D7A134D|nr:protein DEHYDRATION-INDUCED 19 homolog 5-like isoform X2 [Phragmites australis]
MEVEACYNYGFLPAGSRHQPPYGHGPPPPHPTADGELWDYFPCPFCYIEVEVPFICNHLQEEHCFDTKNAVCPICANNLGKDMAAHLRVQHAHLLKRRKPSRPSSWSAAANNSAFGKGTTYEVNSYFEEPQQQHYRMSSNRPYQDPAPDPLLSQFICGVTETDDDATSVDANTENGIAAIPDDERSSKASDSKLGLEERLQRIEFLTEILMSIIL